MIEINNRILIDTINHYGMDNQLTVAMEELAELTQVLAKIKRKEVFDRDHLIEEWADVYYMLQQISTYYQITDKEINQAIWNKQMRQVQRMESGNA